MEATEISHQLDLAREQESMLKHEIRILQGNRRREGVNMDYLKAVLVKYMSASSASSEKAALVPVLATLMEFSEADMEEIERQPGLLEWLGATGPTKAPPQPLPRAKELPAMQPVAAGAEGVADPTANQPPGVVEGDVIETKSASA